jgi:hypothetical protein
VYPVRRPVRSPRAEVTEEVVSERLGHAGIGIILCAYRHLMPGTQEEAAETIDAGLRATLTGWTVTGLARRGRHPRQEARDAVRGLRFLVVRGRDYMSGGDLDWRRGATDTS